jgi:hypothetical protein
LARIEFGNNHRRKEVAILPFSITWEPRGIWRKFTGVVSGDDFLRSQHVMYSDSRYYVSKYAIVDFLDVTDHAITADDIENHLANHIGAAAEHPVRVVAVVTSSQRQPIKRAGTPLTRCRRRRSGCSRPSMMRGRGSRRRSSFEALGEPGSAQSSRRRVRFSRGADRTAHPVVKRHLSTYDEA